MKKVLDIAPGAKGLIFDIDGTITDTMPLHYMAWRDTAKEYGINFTVEFFESVTGMPALQTCNYMMEQFGKRYDSSEFAERKEARFKAVMHQCKPVEPVVALIKKYHGKMPMACGTGGSTQLAWAALEIAGVSDCFEFVVAAEDVKKHKPHPETFLKAAAHIGVDPGACQVFEDGKLGLQAAVAAGMIPTDVTKYYNVTIGQNL